MKMLEYDRLDISEVIDVDKTIDQKNVSFVNIGIF